MDLGRIFHEMIQTVAMDPDLARPISHVSEHVYLFAFEDLLLWTEEEVFHFLKKYSFLVFNVMSSTKQRV